MEKGTDIHNFVRAHTRMIEKLERRCITRFCRTPITERNAELILAYDRTRGLEGLKHGSRIAIMTGLIAFARSLGTDFDKATKEDVKTIIVESDSKYAPWSRAKRRIYFKRFYKWVKQGDDYLTNDEFPAEVRWIKRGFRCSEQNKIQRAMLWTDDEIKELLSATTHPRNKALVSLITETGGRIGEVGGLQISDLYHDDFGYLVHFDGKTGERECRVLYSGPHIAEWLNVHPNRDNPRAALFPQKYHPEKSMTYQGILALLTRLVKHTELKHKRVNPHIFRHSRTTLLEAQGWPEPMIKQYMGWRPDSKMLNTYGHLRSKDANDFMLKTHGVVAKVASKPTMDVQVCSTCRHENGPEGQFCQRCGRPLKLKTALQYTHRRTEASNILNAIADDEELGDDFRAMVKTFLEKRNIADEDSTGA